MATMARPLVSDELWELIEPLTPQVKRRHRYPAASGWMTARC
jgi:hypothetical protein